MTLLVIGGTGFFGKSIIHAFKRNLLDKFGINKLIIVSRSTDTFEINFPELTGENILFIKKDISRCDSLPFADIVIHAASSTNKNDYLNNGVSQLKNIEASVENYCSLAPKYHGKSKIVYCSSGAVYGKQIKDLTSEEDDQNNLESLELGKRLYAQGKRYAEKRILELGINYKLNVSIARCFAFCGKYLPKDQHFAYGNFIGQAELGLPIEVKSNIHVVRSYMNADLLVESLIIIALNSDPFCPIINVGSDNEISIKELAIKIGNKYNVPVILPDDINDSIVDRYVPNIDKLKNLLKKYHE